jgi:hypothetical protein
MADNRRPKQVLEWTSERRRDGRKTEGMRDALREEEWKCDSGWIKKMTTVNRKTTVTLRNRYIHTYIHTYILSSVSELSGCSR